MKLKVRIFVSVFSILIWSSCSSDSSEFDKQLSDSENPTEEFIPDVINLEEKTFNIISLGDSYTIGESVCSTCRFPEQLKDSILEKRENTKVSLKVIARTGWTTTALINAIEKEELLEDYDLATLLIGVNNQFQRKPFELFEDEFPKLVNTAIQLTDLSKDKLIVISIPDYAFTPFGRGSSVISEGIDVYNSYIENYCNENNITFVNITDITKQGLILTELVADDGLHPSALAYSKFVSRILPEACRAIDIDCK